MQGSQIFRVHSAFCSGNYFLKPFIQQIYKVLLESKPRVFLVLKMKMLGLSYL